MINKKNGLRKEKEQELKNNRRNAIAYVPRVSRAPFSSVGSWAIATRVFLAQEIPGGSPGGGASRRGAPELTRTSTETTGRDRSRDAAPRGPRSRGSARIPTARTREFEAIRSRFFFQGARVPPSESSRGAEPGRRARNRTSALYSGSLYL